MFGTSPASSIDAGIDIAAPSYALGFGGRLRYLSDDGVRTADWDEASELATLLRYLVFVHAGDTVRATVAAGVLTGATLGHGAVLDGFTTGLNVDHRRLGLEVGAAWRDVELEIVADDVVVPRVIAARASAPIADDARASGGIVADVTAPRSDTTAVLALLTAGAEYALLAADEDESIIGYTEAIWGVGLGVGLHVGARAELRRDHSRLSAQLEANLGTGGYVNSWLGPLYELERQHVVTSDGTMGTLLDVANAGALGGLGATARVAAALPRWGELSAAYVQRAGLPSLVVARLGVPVFARVQAAAWLARTDDEAVMAAEMRVRLPSRLFGALESARLYRGASDGQSEPIWLLMAAVGAELE